MSTTTSVTFVAYDLAMALIAYLASQIHQQIHFDFCFYYSFGYDCVFALNSYFDFRFDYAFVVVYQGYDLYFEFFPAYQVVLHDESLPWGPHSNFFLHPIQILCYLLMVVSLRVSMTLLLHCV